MMTVSEELPASLSFDDTPPFGDATMFGSGFDPTPISPSRDTDEVVALSRRGLRIEHRGDIDVQAGQRLSVRLSHDDLAVDLDARVAHIADRGFRKHTLSLVFEALSDAQRDALNRLMGIERAQLRVA